MEKVGTGRRMRDMGREGGETERLSNNTDKRRGKQVLMND